MRDPLLNALRRNLEIAEASGDSDRVARLQTRIAQQEKSTKAEAAPVAEKAPAAAKPVKKASKTAKKGK
ncbi:MAG TPA: hypothetical protein VJQ79_05965 [Acidimicrobiia bacterium]|nr:hypothetical protein [Acidimicrobiia bacterium]